ncbi:hypothetical protein V8D89_010104 [Ganoderma adspersum]
MTPPPLYILLGHLSHITLILASYLTAHSCSCSHLSSLALHAFLLPAHSTRIGLSIPRCNPHHSSRSSIFPSALHVHVVHNLLPPSSAHTHYSSPFASLPSSSELITCIRRSSLIRTRLYAHSSHGSFSFRHLFGTPHPHPRPHTLRIRTVAAHGGRRRRWHVPPHSLNHCISLSSPLLSSHTSPDITLLPHSYIRFQGTRTLQLQLFNDARAAKAARRGVLPRASHYPPSRAHIPSPPSERGLSFIIHRLHLMCICTVLEVVETQEKGLKTANSSTPVCHVNSQTQTFSART